jgi:anti-anti-sigma regulatory factor
VSSCFDALFHVTYRAGTTPLAVELCGELDLATADQLAAIALHPDASAGVVLDLAGLSFLDARGVAGMLRLADAVPSLRYRNATGIVDRVLRLVEMDDLCADTAVSGPSAS